MKIRLPRPHSRRHGSAIIVVLALLSIAIVYAIGNARVLGGLKRQLGVIEMRQTNSWPRLVPGSQATSPMGPSPGNKTPGNGHG